MKIFTRPISTDVAAEGDPAEPVELHIPEELRPYFDDALEVARATRSFAEPDWRANFSRSAVRAHLERVLVLTEHNGVWPGHIDKPLSRIENQEIGALTVRGDRSTVFRTSEPTMVPPSAEAVEAWRYSEAHKDEYEARLEELTEQIDSDPLRLWNTFLHVAALGIARDRKKKHDRDAAQESARVVAARCPQCGEADEPQNGPVQVRSLLPGLVARTGMGARPVVPTIRSCAACHAVASTDYIAARARDRLADGRTRREQLLTVASMVDASPQ